MRPYTKSDIAKMCGFTYTGNVWADMQDAERERQAILEEEEQENDK